MKSYSRFLSGVVLALSLAACGGGGGGNSVDNNGNHPDGAYLKLTPQSNVSTYEGESVSFTILGTSTRTFDKQPRVAIIETTGAITPEVEISPNSGMSYSVRLVTSPNLPAGNRAINLTVRVCEDDPLVCNKPFPGNPWHVTQNVLVKSKAEGAKRMTLTPAAFEFTTYQGESVAFEISAKGVDYKSRVYLGVVDPLSIISPNVEISESFTSPGPDFKIKMNTLATLAPGVYTTNVELRLCADYDTMACRKPFSGSPLLVPLKLTVKSGTNLSPLPTLAQIGAWSTYQGNASHNAYVPASFDPKNFLRRWTRATDEVSVPSTSVAIDNGRVFHVYSPAPGRTDLVAIREDTGQIEWRVNLGSLHQVNAPAAADNKVYLTSTGHADSYFWVFDQATGLQLGKSIMYSQWGDYLAPTVFNGSVYTQSGYYGGMSAFNGSTGDLLWEQSMPQSHMEWTPAVDADNVYAYMFGRLYVKSLAGLAQFEVVNPDSDSDSAVTPMISGKQMAYLVAQGSLQAFDLVKRTRAWTVPQVVGQPVYVNGVIYALRRTDSGVDSGSVLEARSADKGVLLWTSPPLIGTRKEGYFDSLLLTDNLAFVSSGWSTMAIDLTTRQTVWQNTLGGKMAISNRGVLYIYNTSVDGALGAVNLQ